ncbi:MAG: helix-hairpin-helix domain-containing protein, partial [Eudoraea sp.]|nr:helix-hairpin-helix domain-containing protein [Eudoraea sp.]
MNAKLQDQIDSLKRAQIEDESKLRLVNPNYLSDFKGYILGMSLEEIDRLHSFREKGLFIQSLDEFQNVTGASDSLLEAISPNLRF